MVSDVAIADVGAEEDEDVEESETKMLYKLHSSHFRNSTNHIRETETL